MSSLPILIVGGGPVGAIAALALARQGVPVQVFEAEDRVDDAPRAATTHAATLEMLAELGLIDEVVRRGLIAPKFSIWDRASGDVIAAFDFGLLKNDTRYPFVVQCEQHKLNKMTIERLRRFAHAAYEFASRVRAIRHFDDRVEFEVDTPAGLSRVAGAYAIGAVHGAQGARHRVRGLYPSGAFSGAHHAVRLRRNL